MTLRACKQFTTERLSAFVDGDLSATEAAAVRVHAPNCVACTAAIADLRALVDGARTLNDPDAPPTLWAAIEGELARDGERAAEVAPVSRPRFAWPVRWSWRTFSAGALAGAVVAALAIAAVPVVRGRRLERPPAAPPVETAAAEPADPLLNEAEAEFAEAAAAYERSIAKLRALLAREETRWSLQERGRMAERLARLDEAITRSRELARRTPGDSAGNEQLFAAYQQKIAFLAAAVHRGGEARDWDQPGGRGP
jgi:hypothetical protein